MIGTKMVLQVRWNEPQVFDIYQFRLRWNEPVQWNDNFDSSNRRYDIDCWVKDVDNGDTKTLLRTQAQHYYSGYHEKLRFPDSMNLQVQCRVRAINTAGFSNPWKYTNHINVLDVPIYFPGITGIDLRGLSREDVLSVLTKIAHTLEEESETSGETSGTVALP